MGRLVIKSSFEQRFKEKTQIRWENSVPDTEKGRCRGPRVREGKEMTWRGEEHTIKRCAVDPRIAQGECGPATTQEGPGQPEGEGCCVCPTCSWPIGVRTETVSAGGGERKSEMDGQTDRAQDSD